MNCGGEIYRVIQSPEIYVKSGMGPENSIQQYAELKTKKAGKGFMEDKREAERQAQIAKKQQTQYELAEKYGTTPIDYKEALKKPAYQKTDPKVISKMTNKQKLKYIREGKT